ncbi:Ig-like domain-containing protein [Paenibacillus oleatilyticus]|uniref:Ig-like domain-containing protein n=1 Tax=Paenibacillus oleatilyticus TaxID=2594886 RepID=UPI001C1FDD65|nr:Ig-like domain-containing protein [Paenibacillus oleatilyticus]MBU7320117.1 tandem-95 repeat protein [Paenibacillus oleatilyticus]
MLTRFVRKSGKLLALICAAVMLVTAVLVPAAGQSALAASSSSAGSFQLAVLPDTQMYARYKKEIFLSQTEWIAKNQFNERIAFTAHVGDIVDRRNQDYEWQAADEAMKWLDKYHVPYGYVAGNHDINESQWDDQRNNNAEKFMQYFNPATRMSGSPGFGGVSPSGYCSYYTFEAAGKKFLALFLDWRTSDASIQWAQQVIDAHPDLPVILITHQLLNIAEDGKTAFITAEHGQGLWDKLIKKNDQIFLTVNGHHHGAAHMVKPNDNGKDVLMMVVDYQGGYMGGNGWMRMLKIDLKGNQIKAYSFSPWVMNIPEEERDEFDMERLTDANNEFTVSMNFEQRFGSFWGSQNKVPIAKNADFDTLQDKPVSGKLKGADADFDTLNYHIGSQGSKGTATITDPVSGAFTYTPNAGQTGTDTFTYVVNDGKADSPPGTVSVRIKNPGETNQGTVAHWRMESDQAVEGQPLPDGITVVKDLSGNHNDLYRYNVGRSTPGDLVWSSDAPFKSQSKASIRLFGDKSQGKASYLKTADQAAINNMTFEQGYTIEAYVKLAPDFDKDKHGWMGILARDETGANAGKTGGDPAEPTASLAISTLKEMQWAVYPQNVNDTVTNWSGELFFKWYHVAVVNDGQTTKMYIDGAPVLRNPDGNPVGIATAGKPWTIGSGHYDNVHELSFNGWISEIRITDHALKSSEFLMVQNQTPVAENASISADQDKSASGNLKAADPDGDKLTYSIVNKPAKGVVTVTDEVYGAFTYTPNPGATGTDSFTFKASDGKAMSNEATVTVDIRTNHAPKAENAMYTVIANGQLSGKLAAADADSQDTLTYSIVSQPAKGTLTLENAVLGTFTYKPNPAAAGIDSFVFRAHDGKTNSNDALVVIDIERQTDGSGNRKPAAEYMTFKTNESLALQGKLMAADPDGDPLFYRIVKQGAKGTAAITDSVYGAFTYAPNSKQSGSDMFTYEVSDGKGGTDEAAVVIEIKPNQSPKADNVTYTTNQGVTLNGEFKATDGDQDRLTYSIAKNADKGTVTVTDATYGKFTYKPKPGQSGTDVFHYKVTDGLAEASAIVTITITEPDSDSGSSPDPSTGSGTNTGSGSTGGGGGAPGTKPSTDKASDEVKPDKGAGTNTGNNNGSVPAVTFKDMNAHWANEAVGKLSTLKLFDGFPDGSFKPEQAMTRAEFITVIVRALKLNTNSQAAFSDTGSHWASQAIAAAVAKGIVDGFGDQFKPDQPITREQMAVILVRAFGLSANGTEAKLSDSAAISEWAQSAVSTLINQKLIQGYSDGSFQPKRAATRAEVATMLLRLLEFKAQP